MQYTRAMQVNIKHTHTSCSSRSFLSINPGSRRVHTTGKEWLRHACIYREHERRRYTHWKALIHEVTYERRLRDFYALGRCAVSMCIQTCCTRCLYTATTEIKLYRELEEILVSLWCWVYMRWIVCLASIVCGRIFCQVSGKGGRFIACSCA